MTDDYDSKKYAEFARKLFDAYGVEAINGECVTVVEVDNLARRVGIRSNSVCAALVRCIASLLEEIESMGKNGGDNAQSASPAVLEKAGSEYNREKYLNAAKQLYLRFGDKAVEGACIPLEMSRVMFEECGIDCGKGTVRNFIRVIVAMREKMLAHGIDFDRDDDSGDKTVYTRMDDSTFTKRADVIDHPSHYDNGSMECIEEMRLAFGDEAVRDFCVCNAWKYRYRAGSKGDADEDRNKADRYMTYAARLSWCMNVLADQTSHPITRDDLWDASNRFVGEEAD